MLQDLDRTLEELLKNELPPEVISPPEGKSVTISFSTPDKDFATRVEVPAIDLFLYNVRENMELRTVPWSVERENGMASKKRNPVRVDCSYLITAWLEEENDENKQEHRLLGEVMKVLLRHRIIPGAVLQGDMQGQEPPIRTTALGQPQLQSMGEFWQAIGGKPRAALNYTVTISVDVNDVVETVPLGMSMDDVKVHYNSSKPAQLQALAYTRGTEIHVGPGQEKNLPHEAWHVVQQKQRRVKPTMQLQGMGVNDDSALEHEADVKGKQASLFIPIKKNEPEKVRERYNTGSREGQDLSAHELSRVVQQQGSSDGVVQKVKAPLAKQESLQDDYEEEDERKNPTEVRRRQRTIIWASGNKSSLPPITREENQSQERPQNPDLKRRKSYKEAVTEGSLLEKGKKAVESLEGIQQEAKAAIDKVKKSAVAGEAIENAAAIVENVTGTTGLFGTQGLGNTSYVDVGPKLEAPFANAVSDEGTRANISGANDFLGGMAGTVGNTLNLYREISTLFDEDASNRDKIVAGLGAAGAAAGAYGNIIKAEAGIWDIATKWQDTKSSRFFGKEVAASSDLKFVGDWASVGAGGLGFIKEGVEFVTGVSGIEGWRERKEAAGWSGVARSVGGEAAKLASLAHEGVATAREALKLVGQYQGGSDVTKSALHGTVQTLNNVTSGLTVALSGAQLLQQGYKGFKAQGRKSLLADKKSQYVSSEERAALEHLEEIQIKKQKRAAIDALTATGGVVAGSLALSGFGVIPGLAVGAGTGIVKGSQLGARTGKQWRRNAQAEKHQGESYQEWQQRQREKLQNAGFWKELKIKGTIKTTANWNKSTAEKAQRNAATAAMLLEMNDEALYGVLGLSRQKLTDGEVEKNLKKKDRNAMQELTGDKKQRFLREKKIEMIIEALKKR